MDRSLYSLRDITVSFGPSSGPAVHDVSFDVSAGEIVAVVGESGSGKTVTQMASLGLMPVPHDVSGSASFEGVDLLRCGASARRDILGKGIGVVFQDPLAALNPTMKIGAQLAEAVAIHQRGTSSSQRRQLAIESLERVGMGDPRGQLRRYPHQLSGGMRQRVVIAMAIINRPKLIVADEPTTALDVTIQAQILDLFRSLRRQDGVGIVVVTHDFGVVAELADRVVVMRHGRIVETGNVEQIFAEPTDPYTRNLLQQMPKIPHTVDKHRDLK